VRYLTLTVQPNQAAAKQQLAILVEEIQGKFPKTMDVLERTEEDILADVVFPMEHGKTDLLNEPA
jgi:putative transposase